MQLEPEDVEAVLADRGLADRGAGAQAADADRGAVASVVREDLAAALEE